MIEINQLDLFSGIGGFHLGFERAGYKVNSYFSEIDKHAVAVYKQQFKESKYVGSVTNVRGADLPQIDLITFGSPCQDFSLAGKRQGMGGERSSLILEAIRLISECRPRVFVWENVKGTFSSNDGEDFAAILQSFTNIGGYRLEWQLLNTSWFLPQNRERIYLVGYSTTPERGWRGVFPIGTTSGKLDKRASKIAATLQHPGNSGGNYRGMNMVAESCEIKVNSATSKGYEVANIGDTFYLGQPSSTTRRGRVSKQKASTLDTGPNQAVIQANYNYKKVNETIEQNEGKFKTGEVKMMDLHNRRVQDISPCLVEPHHNAASLFNGYRIRRLTPIECERLQGFPDNHTSLGDYDGEVKPVSNTQRYKQCGNAVTVDVVKAVAEKLKPLFK